MKNIILSTFKFYKNVFSSREDSAIDEIEENGVAIFFSPIIAFLLLVIVFLLIQNVIPIILMLPFLIIHVVTTVNYSNKATEREEMRTEKERREKRQKEHEERIRKMDKLFEEMLRNEREKYYRQYTGNQRGQSSQNNHSNQNKQKTNHQQSNNVDQNIVNAMKLLGLQKGFTVKDVKSAYRRLSKIHHPDVGGTENNFKKLNTAYNYIMERI